MNLNAHVGLTLFVLPAYKEDLTAEENAKEAQYQPGSASSIAKRELGDPDLFPLSSTPISRTCRKPLVLGPQMKLVIPQDITRAMILKAHQKART